MHDSFGDGWNGAHANWAGNGAVAPAPFTLQHGHQGQTQVCGDGCFTLHVTGGSWTEEVGWMFAGVSGGHDAHGPSHSFEFAGGTVYPVPSCPGTVATSLMEEAVPDVRGVPSGASAVLAGSSLLVVAVLIVIKRRHVDRVAYQPIPESTV